MPATAYVARILEQLVQQGTPAGVDAEVFRGFVRGVGRQFRAPYRTRHNPIEVVDHLTELFGHALQRQADEIRISTRWDDGLVVVSTLMADQPFIMDTLLLVLRTHGATYLGGFNAVILTTRDAGGRLVGTGAGTAESLIRAEVEGVAEADLPQLEADLRTALGVAQLMVRDFSAMTELVDAAAYRFSRQADRLPDQGEALRETAEFLRWLLNDNFVFMGAAFGEDRYGVARPEGGAVWAAPDQTEGWDAAQEGLVRVRKGATESKVHRTGRVDEIRIDVPHEQGVSGRPLVLRGLFTYKAVTQPSRNVPVLRQTLARILSKDEAKPGSFRYRGVANAFDSLPTEFLFTASADEIAEMIDRVLEAEQEQRVRVHIRQKPEADMAFALVAMPKGRWTDKMRGEIEDLLMGVLGASYSDHGVFVGRYDTMLLHFYLTGVGQITDAQAETLTEQVASLATPWTDRLYDALDAHHGEDAADALILKYGVAFDDAYQSRNTPERAILDIARIEQLGDAAPVRCDVYEENGAVYLRVFEKSDLILSDILPVLDTFGLVVVTEVADTVHPLHAAAVHIDTFQLQDPSGGGPNPALEHASHLIEGLQAVFTQAMPSDPLNRLLLRARLPWQAVDLFRAYNGYARQLGQRYTIGRVVEILSGRPDLLSDLWSLFQARFDPDQTEGREARVEAARERFLDAIRSVTDGDLDSTFRNLHNLIESTIRTNFYRTDKPFHYISMKFDHSVIKTMPSPRMMYEIYVHHREVEGLHLRGGKIARGGIRWSDREDFRREILGLVSTQMVKNVVIVPEGSKGGFFIKNPSTRDPRELRRKADELYQVLIRGLLDVTDNIVEGKVVPPPRVVRWDQDDPYLVVAADKGTAHLSDTANRLSRAYGFWLDDAFASGGSNGYDHKIVGITARGGWVLAYRHFREMGKDARKDLFTAVGIGDTSGDVFGNGVVETPKMRLLAAFNHQHVFLDPNPDADVTFAERRRLFDEAKGWDHYNTALISTGGGIYDRKAKSIPLSPEARQMLGALQPELSPDAVIRLILRMDVDLLWNGGIGTYVKATFESHQDAGDPPNDDLRVNANELRCKIVGEGGNLGFTQAARIEYALRGGRINTDAIDNSGGVDLSDHEVNLKILLNPMVSSGRLSLDERNSLLESMTEEVALKVLEDNDLHGRQLSLDVVRSTRDPLYYARTIDWVCARSGRTRAELTLPSDEELSRRAAAGQGMTRPELAVLQAHVKLHVYKGLLQDDQSQIPGFDQMVVNYFPATVRERYLADIPGHMLHKSIGMTAVLTQVVCDSGATYFPTLMELTGCSAAAAAGAWLYAMNLIGAHEVRAALQGCEASSAARYQAWVQLTDQVTQLAALWLAPGEGGPWKEDLGRIAEVLGRIPGVRSAAREERARLRADQLVAWKIPGGVAQRIIGLEDLTNAREVALLVRPGEDVQTAVVRYLSVGLASRILPALRALQARKTVGRWDPVALGVLRNRFLSLLRPMAAEIPLGDEVSVGVDRLAAALARGGLSRLQGEMEQVLGLAPDVSTLLVAEERLRGFLARTKLAEIKVG